MFSAASLYVSWLALHRDNSKLKIKLDFRVTQRQGKAYLVKITNIGRRPASIIKVYARLYNGRHYPVYDTETLLNEQEYKEILVGMSGFRSMHPLKIRAFELEDAAGNLTRVYTWPLWWQIRKVWNPRLDEV